MKIEFSDFYITMCFDYKVDMSGNAEYNALTFILQCVSIISDAECDFSDDDEQFYITMCFDYKASMVTNATIMNEFYITMCFDYKSDGSGLGDGFVVVLYYNVFRL